MGVFLGWGTDAVGSLPNIEPFEVRLTDIPIAHSIVQKTNAPSTNRSSRMTILLLCQARLTMMRKGLPPVSLQAFSLASDRILQLCITASSIVHHASWDELVLEIRLAGYDYSWFSLYYCFCLSLRIPHLHATMHPLRSSGPLSGRHVWSSLDCKPYEPTTAKRLSQWRTSDDFMFKACCCMLSRR